MKQTIQNILRDKGLIDNGVSDILAEVCENMTYDVIRNEMNFANMATEAMSAIIISNGKDGIVDPEFAASQAIDHAEELQKALFKRITLLQQKALEIAN